LNTGFAHLTLTKKDAVGKTDAEVCELLDREIDAFIVHRDEYSPIPRIPKEYWANHQKANMGNHLSR
jgi:hypothetical protein